MIRAKVFEVTKYSPDVWPEGMDAIIQRIGSGVGLSLADYKDYKYDTFHPRVMDYKIRLGYHYLRSNMPWKDQANRMLDASRGDFHAYIDDFEETGNVLSRAFVAMAMEFNTYVAAQTGCRVLTYTNRSIYKDYIAAFDGARAQAFGLHLAYPTDGYIIKPNIDTLQPTLPGGRFGWDLLQYSFGEHNSDHVEKDVFNGSVDDMRIWAGIDSTPVIPPTTGNITSVTVRYSNGDERTL